MQTATMIGSNTLGSSSLTCTHFSSESVTSAPPRTTEIVVTDGDAFVFEAVRYYVDKLERRDQRVGSRDVAAVTVIEPRSRMRRVAFQAIGTGVVTFDDEDIEYEIDGTRAILRTWASRTFVENFLIRAMDRYAETRFS